jgi:RNA polymerase sigma factor (sigma-70 family)
VIHTASTDHDLPDETCSLERVVRSALRRLGQSEGTHLLDDCLQEARVCLWQLRPRLEALSDRERALYARASVRHAVAAVLKREYRQRGPAISLNDLKVELVALGPGAGGDGDLAATLAAGADHWLDEIDHIVVSRLIARLRKRDRQLLHFYFAHGMTDAEIARSLGLSKSCVEQRRSRLLRRLRQAIHAWEAGAPGGTWSGDGRNRSHCQVPSGRRT